MNPPVVNEFDRTLLPIVKCTVPKNNTKSGGSKKTSNKKSVLQVSAAKFVDELGKRGIEHLKQRLGLNTELHHVDVAAGSAALGTSLALIQGAITVPQGTTNITRVGDSLRVVSWEQYFAAWSTATNTAACKVRFIGVANRSNIPATSPAGAKILQDITDIDSPYSETFNAYGLQIVFDRKMHLSAQSSGNSDSSVSDQKIWQPSDFHMEWTVGDTTGVQADLIHGGLYVYAMYGQNAGAIVSAPVFSITSRLTFVDN